MRIFFLSMIIFLSLRPAQAFDFSETIQDISAKNNVCIIIDAYPNKDNIQCNSDIKSVADIYKYKITRISGNTILLQKQFSNIQDIPDITCNEIEYQIEQASRFAPIIAPSPRKSSKSPNPLIDYANKITEIELKKLNEGIPVKNLPDNITNDIIKASCFIHLNIEFDIFRQSLGLSKITNPLNIFEFDSVQKTLLFHTENSARKFNIFPHADNAEQSATTTADKYWISRKYRARCSYKKLLDEYRKNSPITSNTPEEIPLYIYGQQYSSAETILRSICQMKNWYFSKKQTGAFYISSLDPDIKISSTNFQSAIRALTPNSIINFRFFLSNQPIPETSGTISTFQNTAKSRVIAQLSGKQENTYKWTGLEENTKENIYLFNILSIYLSDSSFIFKKLPSYISDVKNGYLRCQLSTFSNGQKSLMLFVSEKPTGAGISCSLVRTTFKGK
jgi:hypothetical protein